MNLVLGLRVRAERERKGILVRLWRHWKEMAYLVIGIRGLQAEIEFPSDWHEERRGWIRVGLGVVRFAVSFPWPWVVPDEHQCSGPTYGFTFFDDGLHLHWGKDTGRRDRRRMTILKMPWAWRGYEREDLSAPETHPYRYLLRSGELQERQATIKSKRCSWTRPWLPWKRVRSYIDVDFNSEVGERSGSWKGGVLGCSFEMREHESPRSALLRMQDERRFH